MTARNARRQHRSLWSIFAAPTWIALASTFGLVSALMGDGAWNAVAWLGLGVPVLAMAYALRYRAG